MLRLADIPNPWKTLIVVAFAVGFSGVLGSGYCEHELRFSSSAAPDMTLSVARDFKGHARFISPTDERICATSDWGAFGGIAAFVAMGLLAHASVNQRRR